MAQYIKSKYIKSISKVSKVTKHSAKSLRNAIRTRSVSDVSLTAAPSIADCPILELSFSAINTLQCNDGKLVLVLLNGDATEEIGRTQVVADSSNSELSWPENIPVKYCFGAYQSLLIHVHYVRQAFHDCPVEQLQLQDQPLLAESRCNLSQIVTAKKRTFTLALQRKHMRWQICKLTVRAEETLASTVFSLNVEYCPTYPMRTKERGTQGQRLKVSKVVNKRTSELHTTKPVKSNLNSEWSVRLTRQEIGSKDGKLVIEGFNISSKGNHTKFGELQASVFDLESGRKKVNKSLSVNMSKSYTFLDYFSIYKLCFMVAVEFSATIGRPKNLTRWEHSDSSSNLIPHLQVIKCVGEALECYDSYRRFPAWAFGGKTSMNGETSSCFNLNLNPNNCEVNKVHGIITAYQSALKKVKLDDDDPASLSEVIKKASDFAANSCRHNCHKYYVLLIIMDRALFDVQNAIDSLVDASKQPLSILIVGMGDSTSFNNMKERCASNVHLENSKGDTALRDTVLCMPHCELPTDEQCMAETLLKGIPEQFCDYMQKEGIKPCLA